MGFATALETITTVFGETAFSGTALIMQVTILIGTVAIITRRLNKWGDLAFPVAIGWHLAIIPMNTIILIIAGIIWVLSGLSAGGIVKTLGGIGGTFAKMGSTTKEKTAKLIKTRKARPKSITEGIEISQKDRYHENVRKLMETTKIKAEVD